MQIIIILLAIALLTFLVMKGFNMPLAALIVAGVLLLLSGANIHEGYTVTFMTTFGNVFKNFYLLMFLAAFFGKLIEMGGFSNTLSNNIIDRLGTKHVITAIFFATLLMGYGGVNVYVAIFSLYPMAVGMFRKANIPRRMFVITYVAASCFTTAGPWTVVMHNVLPTQYLGTTLTAGSLVFLIVMAVFIPVDIIYINRLTKKFQDQGVGFIPLETDVEWSSDQKCPNLIVGLVPMVVLLLCANLLTIPVELSVLIGIVTAFICYWPYLPKKADAYFKGVQETLVGVLLMCCSIGSASGFGSIVTSSEGFSGIMPVIQSLNINPLILVALIVAVMAGVTASSSGGLAVAMPIISGYAEMGINPAAIHRVATMACVTFETLPHCGVVMALMGFSGTNPREAYGGVFVVSVLVPVAFTALGILLFTIFGQVYV